MTGVAVKLTVAPVQTVVASAAMVMLTGRLGFTIMVTAFDVAGLPVGQVASEVRTQVITSPFTGAYV